MSTAPDDRSASGLELARAYAAEVVGPVLDARLPGVPCALARLGSGSDVLGLDDAVSRDHDWGLRLTVLVGAEPAAPAGVADPADVDRVAAVLDAHVPETFRGLPTRFATTWEPVARLRVEVDTPDGFARSRLGVSPDRVWDAVDWLALTGQAVLEVTAGAVFTDPAGRLTAIRRALAWYPDDVALHVLAAGWARLRQELPFVGRTGSRGDDAGSRLVAARLAGAVVHLAFLLARRWPPYPKWRGTVFAGLPAAATVGPPLAAVLAADTWQDREAALCTAAEALHDLQRAAGLPTGASAVEPFFDRPFRGLADVAAPLLAAVRDPAVRALPAGVGSVEQWVDAVDVLAPPRRRVAAVAWLRDLPPR